MTNSDQLRSLALFVPALFNEFHPQTILLVAGGGVPAWVSKSVNLAIFLGILSYFLRRPVSEFFAERLASVREMLDRAARERNEATSKMAELDQRLNRLGADVEDIKVQARRESAAERERMKAEAKRDIERLRLSAQREIEAAKQVAMAELREFAATKSVDLAEQMIRREMTPADDARLVRRVGEELSKAK